MVRRSIVRAIKVRLAFLAIYPGRVLGAVDAHSAANHLSPDVDAEISLVNVGAVATFVGMTVALTPLAAVLLLRRSNAKRLLIVQWTASLAVLPACVVHAFALRQFAGVLIVFVDLLATFAGVSEAVTATVSDDRLNRVVAPLLQVIVVRLPLHRSLVFDFTDILQHSCEIKSLALPNFKEKIIFLPSRRTRINRARVKLIKSGVSVSIGR